MIDWLSVSFDFVGIYYDGYKTYALDNDSTLLKQLVYFFGWTERINDLRKEKAINGYAEGIGIGEHIRIFYGGQHTKNANNRYSINLLLSGQACREFENFMDGNWNDLLSFLLANGAIVKRIDIALDDFQANEIDIYELEPYIQKDDYLCPMQSVQVIWSRALKNGVKTSAGYSITFGSTGSNQLQIYDKRLERDAAGQPDLHTDVWYRYELRFAKEKAQAVAEKYITCVQENTSHEFMTFTSELLFMTLDIKIRSKTDSDKYRWKTLPAWLKFLDNVKKIKLDTKYKIDTTLIQKKKWFETSYAVFMTKFLFGLEHSGQKQLTQEMWLDGIDRFTEKDLAQVNYYRIGQGYPALTMQDIKDTKYSIEQDMEVED